jgi:XTP/dITP diphosphohydrolase
MADQLNPQRVYCATSNPGKLREFRLAAQRYAARRELQILSLPGLAEIVPCEETGATIDDNAILKAEYYSSRAAGLVFAEDSGLEVLALDGAPGVYSARFSGLNANDDVNKQLLLEPMRGVANRAARFVCVVSLARAGRILKTFRGVVDGSILEEPRGSGGFGYDPLFYYPPLGCTFAELDAEEKLAVSHRGRAITALADCLSSPDFGFRHEE